MMTGPRKRTNPHSERKMDNIQVVFRNFLQLLVFAVSSVKSKFCTEISADGILSFNFLQPLLTDQGKLMHLQKF
jgi:hypothetical protein